MITHGFVESAIKSMTKRNGTVIGVSNESLTLEGIVQEEALGDFRTTKIFFYFAILSASTLGNGMVTAIIIRKMRTASHFLILNLAICDLLTPLISIVFDFVLEENNYVWLYGHVMCKLLWPTQTYFNGASSLTLAAISLDRYRLIMHPFKTRLSRKQVYLMICIVHVFSLVAVSPYVYVLTLQGGSCKELWPGFTYRQAYSLFLCLSQYVLPLTFMVIVYGLAIRTLYNTSARVRGSSIKEKAHQQEVTSKKPQCKHSCRISKTGAIARRISHIPSIWSSPNAKAMKIFIIIVIVFAIFMFPNQVVWLWADFGGRNKTSNFRKISIVCWLFTYTNCVVNPVILGVLSKDFREGFKVIFKGILICFDTSSKAKEAKKEFRKQSNSCTKTASMLLSDGECHAMKPKECNLYPDGHQQQTSLPYGANQPLISSYISTESQSRGFDLHRSAGTFKSLTPENNLQVKRRDFDYAHVSAIPDENLAILPYSLSYEHLEAAFNSSPETDC